MLPIKRRITRRTASKTVVSNAPGNGVKLKQREGAPWKAIKRGVYDDHFAKIAYTYCQRHGAFEGDLAELFNVSTVTIWNWKKRFPEFKKAVVEGKAEFDEFNVERSLIDAASGFEYEEKEYRTIVSESGRIVEVLHSRKVKFVPPSDSAIRFFLTNRLPHKYQITKNVQQTTLDVERKEYQISVSGNQEKDLEEVIRILKSIGKLPASEDVIDAEIKQIH